MTFSTRTPRTATTTLLGMVMALAGLYLLLHNITVTNLFSWSGALYHVPFGRGGVGLTAGGMLVPLLIGVGWLFYNPRSLVGWVLGAGTLLAMVVGVLLSLSFSLRTMSLLDLLLILVLGVGGLGLMARSLKSA